MLDESSCYNSDLKPTPKQLCKPSIGMLELRIINAQGLVPQRKKKEMGVKLQMHFVMLSMVRNGVGRAL